MREPTYSMASASLQKARGILDQPAEDIGDDEASQAIAYALVSIAASLEQLVRERA